MSLLALVLWSCGGGAEDEAQGCGADFASCQVDGAEGRCLLDECLALPACGAEGCPDQGPAFPLADTNLRVCLGSSATLSDGTIDCPGSPGAGDCANTDYCGQDAQYGWDLDHGPEARFEVSTGTEPVVHDAVTGLSWQACSLGQAGEACEGEATLSDWFTAEAACEASTWGGVDDWVLPDAWQLQSLVDCGTTSPAIDLQAFPNSPSHFAQDYDQWWIECGWSASDYAQDPDAAWVLMLNSGDISQGSGLEYHLNDKAAEGWEGCTARCVRAAARPDHDRFLRWSPREAEPLVADLYTGRIWVGCAFGQAGEDCAGDAAMLPWKEALAACEGLSWGGRDDWRLPDVKELRSIVDGARTSPAIDPDAFPATPYYGPVTTPNVGNFWSATARNYNDFALYVDFGTGFSHFYVQSEGRHVRCVR